MFLDELIYSELIKDMTWSYSRITCFEDCPYKWFLKYIKEYNDAPMFYSSYGSFMHELLSRYYSGEIDRAEMLADFLMLFQVRVLGERPKGNIASNYVSAGKEYIKTFKDIEYTPLGIEQLFEFSFADKPFVGYVDYLGEKDGEFFIIDHKSRKLSERSKRKKSTLKDEELDKMLRQLYIYSGAINQVYGKFPKYLCFNCFGNGAFIKEEFDKGKYNDTVAWATSTIQEIQNTTDFHPNIDYFHCRYLCGMNDKCCYWKER